MDILDIALAAKRVFRSALKKNWGANNFGKILAVSENGDVTAVNGAGVEVLTAGDVLYSGSTAYEDGTVGKVLKETSTDTTQLKSEIAELEPVKSLAVDSHFALTDWLNGYIRTSGSTGTIGSDNQYLVSGYDGYYLTQKGDGNTYKISVKTGWLIKRIGEYASNSVGSYIGTIDFSSGSITLTNGHYFVFQIYKDPIANVSPSDVTDDTIVLSITKYTDTSLSLSGKAADAGAVGALTETFHNVNWLDPEEITATTGKYINTSGAVGSGSDYAYTLTYIPVNEGDIVYIVDDGIITNAKFRYVTAYNSSKEVLSSSGMDTAARNYTVPQGVSYVRCTIFVADMASGKLAININQIVPFVDCFSGKVPIQNGENKDRIDALDNLPLTSMPPYVVGALKYRPLASLSKGYICLVTDDGMEGLATYTIPMVTTKEVPCTFAVMSSSEVFANETYTDDVIDAVENHGCAIAQHGGRNWTEYGEYGLNQFFDKEKTFFDALGLPVNAAVVPSHYMSDVVQAVAGGRFGVVRSGYKGYDAAGNYGGTVHNFYDYYTSGEGSNLFGLSSYNFAGRTLEQNQAAIDYAYANNKILIVYWHENALTDDTKAIIEGAIDYAKTKGITFITLDQIPFLNDWAATY